MTYASKAACIMTDLRLQLEVEDIQVFLKVLLLGRTRGEGRAALDNPAQGNLRRRLAVLLADLGARCLDFLVELAGAPAQRRHACTRQLRSLFACTTATALPPQPGTLPFTARLKGS